MSTWNVWNLIKMYKMAIIFMNTSTQLTPCQMMLQSKQSQWVNQTFFHVVDVIDMTSVEFVHARFPNHVVHWIEIWVVQCSLHWVDGIQCLCWKAKKLLERETAICYLSTFLWLLHFPARQHPNSPCQQNCSTVVVNFFSGDAIKISIVPH